MSFLIPLIMSSHKHERDVTPPRSPEHPFEPFDLPLECFYSLEAYDCFCAHFQSRRIKVERFIDLRAF